MRFLQLYALYDEYLADFYRKRPHVAHMSFEGQVRALLMDGFVAPHSYAPFMGTAGYEGVFIVPNCPQAQHRWLRERGETLRNEGDWMHEIARRQVEYYRPDILYLGHTIPPFDSRFIRGLSGRPRLVAGWRASAIPPDTDWSEFDLILSNVEGCRRKALEHGARAAEFFMPAFPSFVLDRLPKAEPEFDVVFSGQIAPLHRRRRDLLLEVGKAPLGWRGEFSIGYFVMAAEPSALPAGIQMYNRGPRFGLEMYAALRSGRIAVNPIGEELYGSSDHVNMRHVETTGAGVFMLTDFHETLAGYFTPGREIETFRNSAELLDKIRHYLEHPGEREEIARRGQERCLRDHGMETRVRQLDAILKRHLERRSGVPERRGAGDDAYSALSDAISLVERGRFPEALTRLAAVPDGGSVLRGFNALRGACLAADGRIPEARHALGEELRRHPDNGEARTLLEKLGGGR